MTNEREEAGSTHVDMPVPMEERPPEGAEDDAAGAGDFAPTQTGIVAGGQTGIGMADPSSVDQEIGDEEPRRPD